MITVCSLWGSPGVTTLAYRCACALAAGRDRCAMVAECDPSGGDMALRLGMAASPGLATLAAAARRGRLPEGLWEHVQEAPSGVGMLFGLTSAEQALSLQDSWKLLASVMASIEEVDLIVDVGRLSPGIGASHPLLEMSRAVILVARPDVPSLVHLARRVGVVTTLGVPVGLVLAGSGSRGPREAEEAAGIPVIASIENLDPNESPGITSQAGGGGRIRTRRFGWGSRGVDDLVRELLSQGWLPYAATSTKRAARNSTNESAGAPGASLAREGIGLLEGSRGEGRQSTRPSMAAISLAETRARTSEAAFRSIATRAEEPSPR